MAQEVRPDFVKIRARITVAVFSRVDLAGLVGSPEWILLTSALVQCHKTLGYVERVNLTHWEKISCQLMSQGGSLGPRCVLKLLCL